MQSVAPTMIRSPRQAPSGAVFKLATSATATPPIAISLATGRVATILSFDTGQALSGLYLAAGGGAFGFFLWVLALKYASPTRVANTITINPFIAMAAGALMLGEPITLPLVLGLAAVIAGVWVATTEARTG